MVAISMGSGASGGGIPLRIITGTSVCDGHDAAIGIMRRVMQAEGAEVIHLGHNRRLIVSATSRTISMSSS